MKTETLATLTILGIVVLSIFFVLVFDSITGNLAQNAYAGNKLYGGAIKKFYAQDAKMDSWGTDRVAQWQWLLNEKKDELDCSFGPEALEAPFPCIFDDDLERYCCLTSAAV